MAAGGVRLDIQGLTKRYGQREVLRQAQLHIAPGEFVAIVGRSGCGKSTLLRLVAGLESATSGAIHLDGQPLQGLSSSTRIMLQEARLLPWKRVLDNVALGLPPSSAKLPRARCSKWAWASASTNGPRACPVASVKVGLGAGAGTPAPHLPLLDEPLGALDALDAH